MCQNNSANLLDFGNKESKKGGMNKKMKVLIVGAGGQGAPCASILARDKGTSKIVLGDIDLGLAMRVKEKIGSDKITVVKLDARKVKDIEEAARGVDVVINLTLMQFNVNVMKAAVSSGAHYVDAAMDYPFIAQLAEGKPLGMDSEFKKAGLTALIACGGSPGVTNVLAKYACDKLDRVDEIKVKLGGKPLEKSREVVRVWDPGWCPEIALLDYAAKPMVFENGKYKECAPFSGCEEYNFPDFVGTVVVCYHLHEEGVTLPHFIGKGIKNVDFKYPVDPIAGAFVKMGFAKSEPINVRGVEVSAMDVLMKLVRHPVGTFFTEDEDTVKAPHERASLVVVDIKGAKSGEEVTYKLYWPYSLFTNPEERLEVYRKLGTTEIGVALPAVAGAKMCVGGDTDKGVIAPECLDAVKFLKMMAETGCPVKFHEECSKEATVS